MSSRHQWLKPIILASWEAEIGRIKAQGQPGKIDHETPHLQNNRAKGTEDMVQVAEHLFCKCKALNSNSSPTQKKKYISNQISHISPFNSHTLPVAITLYNTFLEKDQELSQNLATAIAVAVESGNWRPCNVLYTLPGVHVQ
jgi:hypothetical protein